MYQHDVLEILYNLRYKILFPSEALPTLLPSIPLPGGINSPILLAYFTGRQSGFYWQRRKETQVLLAGGPSSMY